MSPVIGIPIGTERARELGKLSWEHRERKTKPKPSANPQDASAQAERIFKQLRRVETMFGQAKDPDDLQKLSAAHSRLFNAWQVLTATPNPGSRKSSGRNKRGYDEPVNPVPVSEPSKPQPVGQDPNEPNG